MHRVTQRERVIHTSVYRQEVNKAKLGNNIANHMGFIFALALYDKFGLTFKQITNYYTKTVNKRVAWQDDDNDDVTSVLLLRLSRAGTAIIIDEEYDDGYIHPEKEPEVSFS